MMTFLIAEVFLKAAVLSLILYLLARHEADYGFQKVAMVTAGITLGGFLLEQFIPFMVRRIVGEGVSAPVILGVSTILTVGALMLFVASMVARFCWVSARRAAAIAAVYIVFCVGFALATQALKAQFEGVEMVPAAPGPEAKSLPADLREVMEFQEESFGLSDSPAGSGSSAGEWGGDSDAAVPIAPPETPAVEPESTDAPVPTDVAAEGGLEAPGAAAPPVAAPDPVGDAAGPDVEGARKKLKIHGLLRDSAGKPLALVNQQPVEPGETVALDHEGYRYLWRLDSIERGRVNWSLMEVKPLR